MRTIFIRSTMAIALAALVGQAQATNVPQNLGYGLDKLVESNIALKNPARTGALYNGYASEAAAYYAGEAITDAATGRFLVDDTLSGRVSLDDVKILCRQTSRR